MSSVLNTLPRDRIAWCFPKSDLLALQRTADDAVNSFENIPFTVDRNVVHSFRRLTAELSRCIYGSSEIEDAVCGNVARAISDMTCGNLSKARSNLTKVQPRLQRVMRFFHSSSELCSEALLHIEQVMRDHRAYIPSIPLTGPFDSWSKHTAKRKKQKEVFDSQETLNRLALQLKSEAKRVDSRREQYLQLRNDFKDLEAEILATDTAGCTPSHVEDIETTYLGVVAKMLGSSALQGHFRDFYHKIKYGPSPEEDSRPTEQ